MFLETSPMHVCVCVCVCEHAHIQAFVYTWNSISDGLSGDFLHCILPTEM